MYKGITWSNCSLQRRGRMTGICKMNQDKRSVLVPMLNEVVLEAYDAYSC
jgi:hypothetical protein